MIDSCASLSTPYELAPTVSRRHAPGLPPSGRGLCHQINQGRGTAGGRRRVVGELIVRIS